jgi:hypothetical protein
MLPGRSYQVRWLISTSSGTTRAIDNPVLSFQDATVTDTDGDGIPDDIDLDCDNDGITDVVEGRCATNFNESFDSPVETTINGNNIKGTTYGNLVSQNGATFNIIRVDGTGYSFGPNNAQNGFQYLDINGASDYPLYPFTLTEPGIVNISAYFSNRDLTSTAYANWTGKVEILNSTKTTVLASGNAVSFIKTLSDEIWYLSAANNISLPAGSYFFRTYLGDYGHADNITICSSRDNDGDGIPNYLDSDSDNDGIYDVVESGNAAAIAADANNDGVISNAESPSGANGIPLVAESGTEGGVVPPPINTDGTDNPNYLDLDSDNDGCSDANEYYISNTADGGDGGTYGTGTPPVNTKGKVTTAAYTGTYTNAINTNIVACCPITAPLLSATTLANCPSATVNLMTITASNTPSSSVLEWHTAPLPVTFNNKITDPTAVATSGTYYAVFYNALVNCYNTAGATAVAVTVVPCCSVIGINPIIKQ